MSDPVDGLWPLYRTLVGVAIGCGFVIAVVYEATAPRIRANRAEALAAAVFEVLPDAVTRTDFVLDAQGRFIETESPVDAEAVHAGYDAAGHLLGIAISAAGMGYQDTIRLLYSYDPRAETVIGLAVLESRETPGLGARIASDPVFLDNFRRLAVALDADGGKLAEQVSVSRGRGRKQPWEIDGITGATVSSRAVAALLNDSAALWLPKIQAHLEDFTHDGH
jgi:Na+-translocating ferredoxin:NAD+ oxidoreductase subunit G